MEDDQKTPGWLRNKNTGAIQTYHPQKAALPYMEPVFEKPEPTAVPDRKRKVRPFDEAQAKAKKKAAAQAAADAVEAEGEPEQADEPEVMSDIFSADDLDKLEADLKSAMKKDEIASIAMENFGVEIDQSTGVGRAKMKDEVKALIEKARADLEGE